MKSTGFTGTLLSALVLVFLEFICTGNGFKQEVWLYDGQENCNGLHFQSHVSNTSDFSLFLPKVTRVCARGRWNLFSAVNFETYSTARGSLDSSSVFCSYLTTASTLKSLRHLGANETNTDALSLYEGVDLSGKEVFATGRAHLGIRNPIKSIAITGASGWMLFEGLDLDGKEN